MSYVKSPKFTLLLLFLTSGSILFAQPVASFSASPISGCSPLKVDFTNTSQNAVSYLWKFGNGNQSALKNPAAVYNNSGTFTITLIVADSFGNKDTSVLVDYINVFKSPEALLRKLGGGICAGDSVFFQDNSTPGDGAIVSWKWDFGDGGTSNDPEPTYRYAMAGTYDITLALTDANGCQSSSKAVKFVEVNKLPEISFTSNLSSKCKAPLDVTFSPRIGGLAPFQYEWNFGDGNTSTQASPKHTYNSVGGYDVKLKITDANGCTDSTTRPSIVKIQPPIADFVADQTIICPGSSVLFTNLSSPMDGTNAYNWDFGNGNTSSLQNPQVTYTTPGKYTVTLTNRWDGCTAVVRKSFYIHVKEAPTGKISPKDVSVCRVDGGSAKLTVSGNNLATVRWYVNGQFVSNLAANSTFLQSLSSNGTYKILAYFVSPDGCPGGPDTAIVKAKGPVASLTANPKDGCIPFSGAATWTGSGTAPITKYEWSGLGGSANGATFNFNKTTFGNTTLKLKVTDADGCTDTTSIEIDGGLIIEPKLLVPPRVCRNEKFWIHNRSDIRNPDTVIFKYIWNDGAPLDLNIIDSIKKALLDSPGTTGYWTFEANSHGCITKSDPNKRQKTFIMGPKLDGKVKAFCNSDTLRGQNQSTVYTKTYWRFKDENQQIVFDGTLNLIRNLSQTKDLWLFVFNDTNNCSDSMDFKIKIDPVSSKFAHTYNCGSRLLTTENQYPGLGDTSFIWKVTNTTTGKTQSVQSRHLSMVLADGGKYRVELNVVNPDFGCTPGSAVTLTVPARPNGKPVVMVDRTSCYPVTLTMRDPSYNHWRTANWRIGDRTIKDSALSIGHVFTSNVPGFMVLLQRTDSAGCSVSDTFRFQVGGLKAQIGMNQSGNLCNSSTLTFTASTVVAGGPYTYFWDFGHKTSTLQKDTVLIKGYRAFPVSLTIRDDKGCASTATFNAIAQNGSPVARFKVSDTVAACPPMDVFFTDLSIANQYPIVKRLWDFGDNTYSNKDQPGKIYIYPGKYAVGLVVTNSIGCSDTFRIPNLVVVNGPFGTYSFDKKQGCTPLEINLETAISGKILKLEFDMGDGAVLSTGINKHLYERPGAYVPRLLVEDSNGCKFSPSPKDTIRVYAKPIANFVDLRGCDNLAYNIFHQSESEDSLSGIEWKVDGVASGFSNPLPIGFEGTKQRAVSLKVTTINGCSDSLTKPARFYSIEPGLKPNKTEYCLGENAYILQTTTSDTTVVYRRLWLNGIEVDAGDNIPVPATARGEIPALLVVEDALGCRDTSFTPVFIKVGDTLPTVPLTIYRSSVVDDFTTVTKFSQSKEPDFKSYKLYVWLNNQWSLKATSDNILDTNLLVGNLNTLANSYCHRISQLNYCGLETDSTAIVPHCTVEIKAYGDTNQSEVIWSAYTGWNEVEKYRIWRKKSDEDYYQLIDSVNGNITRYIDPSVFCFITYDYHIEAIENQGNRENSWSDTARSVPVHLLSVPAPEVWRTTVNDNLYTHTEWITVDAPKFGVNHFTLYRDAGEGWKLYQDSISPLNFELDDHNTDVQSRTYSYAVQTTDKCNTKSPLSNVGRSILLKVRPEGVDGHPMLRWTPYIYWNEGVDEYKIERSIGGSQFVEIGRVKSEIQHFADPELPPYCQKDFLYRVTALRNQPANYPDSSHFVESVSNYDTFLPPLKFFIPNAFTPNKNNLNEGFKPDGIYYYRYEMKLYNRYGQKLFDEGYCQNAWNGTYNGENAPDGVYAYYIRAWDLKGQLYIFSGTVHLMR